MKKIYMQPLTEVVKINTEQMICESISGVNNVSGLSVTQEEFAGGNTDAKEDWFYNNNLW